MIDLKTLAKKFIDVPSITGSEALLAVDVEANLRAMGMDVARQPVDFDRWNIFASFVKSPSLLYTTHIDTVPPFTPSVEKDGFIFGRGACDAKGIMACMIKAMEELSKEGCHDAALLFVVGEEMDSIGARIAAQRLPEFKYVINGEPTGNQLVSGQKGSLIVRLHAHGVSAHSGYPELGSSAINTLLSVLNDILAEEWGSDEKLGTATVNIGIVKGGVAPNVIPDAAMAEVFFRIVDSAENVLCNLEKIIAERVDLEIISKSDPQELHVVDGIETTVAGFGSDVQYLRKIGTPLMLGPGSIIDAHTNHEKISIEEMDSAVELYKILYHKLIAP
ncbi:MAG: M20/M25/M40 family metallo-hydrolase [Chlorobi bacterium]|nr:M20/M25/M40 family metallo-hydrolase [Chlorobiota bacterium]